MWLQRCCSCEGSLQDAAEIGFHYVLFDSDADGLDPVESGLPYNEW